MNTVSIVVMTLLAAPAVILFIDGFSSAAKKDVDHVKSQKGNDGLMAVVLLITKLYHIFFKSGAWIRRNIFRFGRA